MGFRICFVYIFVGGQWWVDVCVWETPQQCLIGIAMERQSSGDFGHGGENKGVTD